MGGTTRSITGCFQYIPISRIFVAYKKNHLGKLEDFWEIREGKKINRGKGVTLDLLLGENGICCFINFF